MDTFVVANAQRRLETWIADLDDEAVRAPSGLPGWTVGAVLTHLARNADSHCRRAEGAATGVIVEQYPGGLDGRERDIQAGAARSATELRADVVSSAARLADVWANLPPQAWDQTTRDVRGVERPLSALIGRRWQELEVHPLDLGLGLDHRIWSDEFVAAWLPRLHDSLPARLPRGVAAPDVTGVLDERQELAWLYGRLRVAGLPVLAGWG